MMYACALVGFGVFFLFHSGLIQLIFLDDEVFLDDGVVGPLETAHLTRNLVYIPSDSR